MRKGILAVIGAVALAAVPATGSSAQPPGPGGPEEMGPRFGMGMEPGMEPGSRPHQAMARALGLSDEQKAQLEKLRERQRPQHEALREKVRQNHDELRELLESGGADPAAVGEIVLEGHRIHELARALREAQQAALRSLLTPEQQVKLDVLEALRDEGGRGSRRRGAR
jgi:Spy/CpxP family protein refolding chaperone